MLFLITSTGTGGTERALSELLQRLDRARYAVHVCSIKPPGAFARRITAHADGFTSLGMPLAGGRLRALCAGVPALMRLCRLVRRLRPTIVHAFLFRGYLLGRVAGWLCRVPVVISAVRVLEPPCWWRCALDRVTMPLTDSVTAVSGAIRDDLVARLHVPAAKVVTIPNGIDLAQWPAARSAGDPRQLVVVGRLSAQKGHMILLQALPQVARRFADVRVMLYGEGPEEERLRSAARRLGVSRLVVFAGVTEEVAQGIASSSALVLPSLWEGFPNAVLEAMACARPVVATRLPGMAELIQDGRTGLLVPPGDAGALAAALIRVLADPREAAAMGRRGRQRAAACFDIAETVRLTQGLYARALQAQYEGLCRSIP